MAAEIDPNTHLAAQAAVSAGILDTGRLVFQISGAALLVLLVVALLGRPVNALALGTAVVIALVQGVFAQRVRFDADIFRLWASRWHQGTEPAADMAAFDARVGRQVPPPASVEADLGERRRGAHALLRWQVLCAAVQGVLCALALWT